MKIKDNYLHQAKIFLSTTTFKVWQKYCISRSYVATKLGYAASFEIHPPTKKDIKKYIIPAKTFRLWLKAYILRQYLYRIFIISSYNFLKANLSNSTKITIKKYIGLLVGLTGGHVNTYIKNDWNNWAKIRPDGSMDILIFGITSYEYRFQRPQQLAHALAKLGHRVFYIDSEFNYAANPRKSWIDVKKKAKNVFVVKLTSPINHYIYRDVPNTNCQKVLFASIKKLLREARIINPVAKIDHPFWESLSDKLKMPLIYDVMDLHSGFAESGKSVVQNEKNLTKDANVLLSSSDYLAKSLSHYKNKLVMIKNAGDYEHFVKAAKTKVFPEDMKRLSGPIIGYYGAIAEWLDERVIEELLVKYPTASIVLIGRIQNKKIALLAEKYDNLYLLGEKPYAQLPNYLSTFDVCLIPFKITNLIKATNPVKIYEYFASGKPVVATAIPELREYHDILYTGTTPKQFVQQVEKALQEKSVKLQRKRQQVARANTWDLRVKLLERELRARLFPKVSVVILIYNHADLSKISIDSVLQRSKYPNLELIIVDNQSDRETQKMLKAYIGRSHTKVIFNPSNYGFAKGNNVGMKHATGEYIILLNNDVRVTPGWIERLVYHAQGKKVGLVGPVTNSIGNESKIDIEYNWNNAKEIESKSADYIYAHWGETLQLRNIAAFAWLKPRSVYKLIGGLDERFGRGLFEDDDYCVRVGKKNLTILCAEDAFVHHYGGASTNWGSPEFQLLFNTNKAKFESKWKTKWIPHEYRKK